MHNRIYRDVGQSTSGGTWHRSLKSHTLVVFLDLPKFAKRKLHLDVGIFDAYKEIRYNYILSSLPDTLHWRREQIVPKILEYAEYQILA